MNDNIKKSIAVSVTVFIVLVAYYGSYLPMRKAITFISAMQNAGNVRTVSDFEQNFKTALDYPSPVGQEELVRSMANSMMGNIPNIPEPAAVAEIMRFIESYYKPIVDRERGMSFGQDVYILGILNEYSYLKTGEQSYLDAAEKYFGLGQKLGPKRPQPLYGLLDVYKLKGDLESFRKVADQVLSQWPKDERTRSIIDQVLKSATSAASKE